MAYFDIALKDGRELDEFVALFGFTRNAEESDEELRDRWKRTVLRVVS